MATYKGVVKARIVDVRFATSGKITVVEKFRGENWFCSEKEAKAAGFTKSPSCI